jgi:toxin-antitoxin system PIN domain toxin
LFVVDTNLLLYAADQFSAAHKRMRSLLTLWGSSNEAWFGTWSVVYEFLRVATHRSVFAHPLTFADAWNWIEGLRSSPSFGILVETDRHAEVVRDLTREHPHMSGNRLHDLHIAALMREHGVVEIRTADTDFHEFKFLRVVNPL